MGNREKSKWLGLELNQGQFVNKMCGWVDYPWNCYVNRVQ